MTHEWARSGAEPSPAELAAYADGELEPAAAERVEAWLADHPAAAAEVEGLRRLHQLWQEAAPPEPSPEAWRAALARVEAGLPPRAPLPRRAGSRPLWWAAGLAAAVLAAVVLARSLRPTPAPAPPQPPVEEPYPVVAAEDVNIVSMDAQGVGGLVVGRPPVPEGPLPMATDKDIKVVKVEPDEPDEPPPHFEQVGDNPMIWSPAPPAGDQQP